MEGPQKIKLPYDPSIPLLGVYPKDIDIGLSKNPCTRDLLFHYVLIVNDTITHT